MLNEVKSREAGKKLLTPLSLNQIYIRNAKSQSEISSGKLISQKEVEKYFDSKTRKRSVY